MSEVVLTDEQEHVASELVKGAGLRNPLQTLGGFGGTGKTTVIRELARRLPGYAVCAYTGKAADVLRRKGIGGASTIHSLIYRPERDPRTGRTVWQRVHRSLLAAQGFVIDEASMVGRQILADLQEYGRPIIAVGDHGQLPPVGDDAGLMRDPQYKLETIHRNAGPIARFAQLVRTGGNPRDWDEPAPRAPEPRVYVRSKDEATPERLARADQIICAYNRTRVEVNRTVRATLGHAAAGSNVPAVGDRVMCLRNSRDYGIFNGQQGVVTRVEPKRYELEFQPAFGARTWVKYHPEGFDKEKPPEWEGGGRGRFQTELPPIPFDFAYCATAHKTQGDEYGKVIVLEERCKLWDHARWGYTAASRAKECLLWCLA